ncbi:MAG TPA: hypothetical protein VHK01_12030 [Lacipirellulaceae bacterium]|nr:hypothetical protein [Lacipirellulaceae bacterium]
MIARFNIITMVVTCALGLSASFAQAQNHHYGLRYDLSLAPAEDRADVAITVDQRAQGNVWSLRFHIDPQRQKGFQGDGSIEIDGDYVTWNPAEAGGRLSFQVSVSNRRGNGAFDARMTDDWAIFRGDDLFPAAHNQDREDSEADTTLHVRLPDGWSFATPYPEVDDHTYEIDHAHRRFERPIGWMAAGRLGVRRERIAGVRVIVAGPNNHGVRRLDMIALLNWNLPTLRRLVPDMPKRVLIVSAGDPMWRGGLSGPNSVYVHADRPLLSENGSSTLVHELVHVATGIKGEKGGDWIVEGIAEYYSLKLMWRSGTLTDYRYKQSFRKLEKWAQQAGRLDADASRGPVTARAVGIMRKLDHEIHQKTNRQKSLDDVVRLLVAAGKKVNTENFRQAVVEVMGEPAESLSDSQLGLTLVSE